MVAPHLAMPALRVGPLALVALTALASVAPVTGCGPTRLYAGPPRGPDEVAVLLPSRPDQSPARAWPLAVDGAETEGEGGSVEMLPGEHVARVRVYHKLASSEGIEERRAHCELRFHARAGQRYRLGGRVEPGACRAWVRDDGGSVDRAACECGATLEIQRRAPGGAGGEGEMEVFEAWILM